MRLTVAGTGEPLTLAPQRLVIAGYTARDRIAVQAHIDELARIGVAPPPRVPMYYEVPAELATTEPTIVVDGEETSGEIEAVLLTTGGRRFVGLGSDHTDRAVERRDIPESKASAPKPLAGAVLPLDRVEPGWDDVELTCHLDGEPYQRGRLAAMLPPAALLDDVDPPLDGDALMFLGTLPLLGGAFRYGTTYSLGLRLPDGTALHHTYDVKRRSR